LAGLDIDDDVRIVSTPGSSLLDMLRPRPSSQPAAASLPEAFAAFVGQAVVQLVESAQEAVSGTTALLLGDYRF
jgi:protease-4